ncbi:lipopolysaccharide biosynthesis protein [Roseomonas elaeocarpi]|uniref:Lipopolysaccharide biosynthesis protein n=1 Tax=Roseomonas elaeocarpi TaxID=907779 RepID=A0ABV6JTX7_9PROT
MPDQPAQPSNSEKKTKRQSWFADATLRGVLRNAGLLLGGKASGALLHLAGLALAARALGPQAFGVLTLINTYALTASGLARFQSWQAIIQYGTPALHGEDRQRLVDVLLFALALDLGTGFLGMLGAMVLLPWLGENVGIPRNQLGVALAYATLIPTMTIATPTGVLRLLDRFDLMAWQSIVLPGLRLVGVAACWLAGAPFVAYALVWWLSDLVGDIVLIWMAWWELHRRGLLEGVRPRLRAVTSPGEGIWSFVWFTNLGSSLNVAWGPLSNLVVGAVLGPAAAGLYRVAQTVTDALTKPAELLSRAFYPEIARLRQNARTDDFWRLSARSAGLAGLGAAAAAAVVALLASPFVRAAFGGSYAAAAVPLAIMAISLVLTVPAFPLEPLLVTLGHVRTAFVVRAAVTVTYLGLLGALAHLAGLTGAAVAYVLGALGLAAGMLLALLLLRRRV